MFFKDRPFRIRYFLNHLCLSFAIGSLTAFTVYAVWYPGLLAKAVGVSHIFLLLLCIDVIAGPLMTLFLAKEEKKGVWFDLIAVIAIQFIALLYGIWHIAEGRPAWQVINIYRVELVSALDMQYDHAKPPFSSNSWGSPGWALVRPAKDKVEQSDWLWQELEGHGSPAQRAELFIPLEGNWQHIDKEVKPLDELERYNTAEAVAAVKREHPKADGYMPMIGGDMDMTVLVSRKGQKILAIADLRPW